MNLFEMYANDYRKMMDRGEISKQEGQRRIRIYEFLATCDDDDLCIMMDSTALNDIMKAYWQTAINNARDVDDDAKAAIRSQLRHALSDHTAKDVLQKYYGSF